MAVLALGKTPFKLTCDGANCKLNKSVNKVPSTCQFLLPGQLADACAIWQTGAWLQYPPVLLPVPCAVHLSAMHTASRLPFFWTEAITDFFVFSLVAPRGTVRQKTEFRRVSFRAEPSLPLSTNGFIYLQIKLGYDG